MTSSAVRTAPGTEVAKSTPNSHSSPGASSICWQRPSGRKSPAASPRTSIVVSFSVFSPLLSIVTVDSQPSSSQLSAGGLTVIPTPSSSSLSSPCVGGNARGRGKVSGRFWA